MIRALLVCLLLSLAVVPSVSAAEVDECHSGLSAYAGVQPYIVNPSVASRATARIVAVFQDTEGLGNRETSYEIFVRRAGDVAARIDGHVVLRGSEQAEAVVTWNPRDVADGEYTLEIVARTADGLVAHSTPVSVVVDRAGVYDQLFSDRTRVRLRAEAAGIDTTFPYQFFYGTTHAHTRWSDGGMPVSDCQSGRYGYAGGAEPAHAFSYAKTSGSIDFLAVVEHNHLMQEACSGCTAEQVKARYVSGFTAAQTATVAGSFVGLWGMEWGVISGGGHVNIYNQAQLMSWAGEPLHVVTDKSNYPMLYTALKNNQGVLGSYGTFNHPETTDFGSWTRSADGDAVMRGLSIVSGPAFSTSTSFTPGGSTYKARYDQALSYGWKIAPEAHQDNHCWNYGNATPNRTVAIVPNGTTFTQQSLLAAMNGRRIYAAQDRDVQLVYRTSDSTRVMGDTFSASSAVGVYVRLADPAGEGVQKIEVWGGRAGTTSAPGAAPTIVASNTSSTTLSASLAAKPSGESWYYYVLAVQADGNSVWSAPMWIDWGTTTPQPVTLLSEGAESGAAGWTFTKNTGSGWSIEASTDSRSGAFRFKTNVGYTTYLNGADWSVVSPSFSLAGRTSATLTFYNKYKTESGYDFSRVEISTNGGTSWTSLRSVSGTSSGHPAWAPQVSLSLNSYVGQSNVKLRFRFTSDSTVADWGVALDDIVVTAQ